MAARLDDRGLGRRSGAPRICGSSAGRPLDRPGDQLREPRHERGERDQVVLGVELAAVDGEHVGQRLEGVEADADRQQRCRAVNGSADEPEPAEHVGEAVAKKSKYLKTAEDPELHREARGEERACAAAASSVASRPRPTT